VFQMNFAIVRQPIEGAALHVSTQVGHRATIHVATFVIPSMGKGFISATSHSHPAQLCRRGSVGCETVETLKLLNMGDVCKGRVVTTCEARAVALVEAWRKGGEDPIPYAHHHMDRRDCDRVKVLALAGLYDNIEFVPLIGSALAPFVTKLGQLCVVSGHTGKFDSQSTSLHTLVGRVFSA